MDNLASRLYYVDNSVIVSDSPRVGAPVLYFRNGVLPKDELAVVLRRLSMRIVGQLQTDPENNQFYQLEAI